jgi:hypothetical protein
MSSGGSAIHGNLELATKAQLGTRRPGCDAIASLHTATTDCVNVALGGRQVITRFSEQPANAVARHSTWLAIG